MATSILKILSGYCAKYVDDIRLNELADTDAPLYAWNMYCYFLPAISLFAIPSEMPTYLFGTQTEPKFTESVFANTNYTTEEESTSNLTITLGEEYSGFDLCAARIKNTDEFNRVTYTPLNIAYNSENGTVVVMTTETAPIPQGAFIDIDFYKDGQFERDLTPQMMNILGMCFQVVWQDRFNTDWLSIVPKVEDKSFFEQNRANKMNADTTRLEQLRRKLSGEMRRFEQNLAYNKNMPSGKRLI